jgi:hypothetical protein
VSTLQRTNGTVDKAIVIAPTVLIYFISYFFIFIYENQMKRITLDYSTALMSLVPPIIYLAAIHIFLRSTK